MEILWTFPQPQCDAIFLRRTQRFLAEMRLTDGSIELVYCANPGSMRGNLTPDRRALIWDSGDPRRRRRYTWRAVEHEGVWVGTDTHLSNRIVEEALRSKLLPGLESYEDVARERLVESGFRIDFILSGSRGECLVEVKSANVVENGIARFPDSSTTRGLKQLRSLTRMAAEGRRSVLVFLAQRSDAHSFEVCRAHDLAYVEAFEKALASGVEIIPISVPVCREGVGRPQLLSWSASMR